MAKTFYNDVIVSEVVEIVNGTLINEVIHVFKHVELKESNHMVKTLRRVLPKKYYVESIGPGQYEEGSIYQSKV